MRIAEAKADPKCLKCGGYLPSSHVAVRNQKGRIVGSICGHHKFREIILDGRFDVHVELDPEL